MRRPSQESRPGPGGEPSSARWVLQAVGRAIAVLVLVIALAVLLHSFAFTIG